MLTVHGNTVQDLVGLKQCLLVQSFNITLQKQLEMELDSAKSQLER